MREPFPGVTTEHRTSFLLVNMTMPNNRYEKQQTNGQDR